MSVQWWITDVPVSFEDAMRARQKGVGVVRGIVAEQNGRPEVCATVRPDRWFDLVLPDGPTLCLAGPAAVHDLLTVLDWERQGAAKRATHG